MLQLGKKQHVQVRRIAPQGFYVAIEEDEEEVLLPTKEAKGAIKEGDTIEVFVYRDSNDLKIATMKTPLLTLGEVASLKVVEVTSIGAFLGWGLLKDLLLPFKEQTKRLEKGEEVFVGLYIDKSDRLCATMKVYDLLSTESPYKQNQKIEGIVYTIKEDLGALVAIDGKYHGLIPQKELLFNPCKVGQKITARVKRMKEDGKLELSFREQTFYQIEKDAKKIMDILEKNNGKLNLHDKSNPKEIERMLQMSKAAFKRAIGKLLKEGAIRIQPEGIEKAW
jgi:hypothetical protein